MHITDNSMKFLPSPPLIFQLSQNLEEKTDCDGTFSTSTRLLLAVPKPLLPTVPIPVLIPQGSGPWALLEM